MTKYPHITVQLAGRDGNAFAIIAAVVKALRKEGIEKAEIDAFTKAAMSGDYQNLLRTACQTVNVK